MLFGGRKSLVFLAVFCGCKKQSPDYTADRPVSNPLFSTTDLLKTTSLRI
jgi:hypothetical protein